MGQPFLILDHDSRSFFVQSLKRFDLISLLRELGIKAIDYRLFLEQIL